MPSNPQSLPSLKRAKWEPIAATVREIMARRGITYRALAAELGEESFQTVYRAIAKGLCFGSGNTAGAGSAERRIKRVHRWIEKHAKISTRSKTKKTNKP